MANTLKSKRDDVWMHNAYRGWCVSMTKQIALIEASSTATPESKAICVTARNVVYALGESLKKRNDQK